MIYLLMESSEDYESPDRIIFGHHDKEVVEKIHDQIKKRHEGMHELARRWSNDVDQIRKLMPRPTEPDLAKLPIRPLVWVDGPGWCNAHMLDHDEKCKQHEAEVQKELDRLKQDYLNYYKDLEKVDMDIMWSYLRDRKFYVHDVEDDPNVDVRTL